MTIESYRTSSAFYAILRGFVARIFCIDRMRCHHKPATDLEIYDYLLN